MTEQNFNLDLFSPKEAELKKKAQEYSKLEIKWIDDKVWLEIVRKSRIELKNQRVEIEKFFKLVKQTIDAKKKEVLDKEKYYVWLIETTEVSLKEKEDKINSEIERIKKEKEEAEMKKTQERMQQLFSVWFIDANMLEVSMMTDDEFITLYNQKKAEFEILEAERIAKEKKEAEDKLELEKLRAEKETLEAEKRKLEEEKEQIKKDKEIEQFKKTIQIEAEEKARKAIEAEKLLKEQQEKEAQAKLEKEKKYKDWISFHEWKFDKIINEWSRIVLYKEISFFEI